MSSEFQRFGMDYAQRMNAAVQALPLPAVETLAEALRRCWREGRQLFVFGNGSSAGNAIRLANDYPYGISRKVGHALRVTAPPANSAVLTCLANDKGCDNIFHHQLAVLAQPGYEVLAFSGRGNSPNIVKALQWCKGNGVQSFAVLGFSGGQCKALADVPIHVPVDDMQISEDLQLVVLLDAERAPLCKANLLQEGSDVTLVSMSFITIEAIHASDHLASLGVSCDLIDLRTIRPIDWELIQTSVRKTGRLLVLDTGSLACSVSGEIASRVTETCLGSLRAPPRRIAMRSIPTPCSPACRNSRLAMRTSWWIQDARSRGRCRPGGSRDASACSMTLTTRR